MSQFQGTVQVFVNGDAGKGKALALWNRLESEVRKHLPDMKVWKSASYAELVDQVRRAAQEQATTFLAAGGDGTVQAVLDGLFDEQGRTVSRQKPFVGGFALGEGNRLYQVCGGQSGVGGVSARWRPESAAEWDILRLELTLEHGGRQIRHALQSAHLGVIAAAHREVRLPSGIWKYLLNWFGFKAQALVSVWQAFRDPGFVAEVSDGKESWSGTWAGLHLVKYPWVAGNFTIKTPRVSDDGLVDLAFYPKPAQGMETMGLIGSFEQQGLKQEKVTYRETSVGEVRLQTPCTICFDGEIASVKELRWQVLPKAILLGN